MLSTTTKHALRALVVLAGRQEGAGEPMRGRDLAAAARIPASYAAKVLRDLRLAGLVGAARGGGGGYRLARPARGIALIEIVEVFEGVLARPGCILACDHPCSQEDPCTAHEAWRAVRQAHIDFLEGTTLADIATHPAGPASQGAGPHEGGHRA